MLPVLIAFAGVLVAAVATGMLAGRCVRGSRLCSAVWTGAAFGLMVALAGAGVGLATGFGPLSFRAAEIGAQLIAPLWLAWGLIELVSRSEAVRFGVRLGFGFALTIVPGLILGTDTLSAVPFSKAWPTASQHYQPVSHYALALVQVTAIIGMLAAVGMTWSRARSEPEWAPAMVGVGALGLAVLLTVALRFSLPARSAYPLMAALAAGLVWFGVTRGLRTVDDSWRPAGREDRSRRSSRSRRDGGVSQDQQDPRDVRDSRDARGLRDQRDDAGRYGRHGQRPDERGYEQQHYEPQGYAQGAYSQDPYRQDEYGQDQYGRRQFGYGSQDQQVPDPYAHGQSQYSQDQYAPDPYSQQQYTRDPYGQPQYAPDPYAQQQPAPDPYAQSQYAPDPYSQPQYAPDPYSQPQYAPDPYGPPQYAPDPYGPPQYAPDPYAQPQYAPDRHEPDHRGPEPYGSQGGYNGYARDGGYGYGREGRSEANGRYEANGRSERSIPRATSSAHGHAGPGAAASASVPIPDGTIAEAEFSAEVAPASRAAQSRPYGRLQIFTLLDDKAADFDRLAEQTAEEVRIGEPDTLVYVIHLVPNAPMQRIFYEIYRNRAAFDSHENKSYTKRFVSERRGYVLATNIIELRLKYAKVAPLPVDSRQLDTGRTARAQLPPGPTATAAPRYDTPGAQYDTAVARPAASSHRQSGGGPASADPRYGRV